MGKVEVWDEVSRGILNLLFFEAELSFSESGINRLFEGFEKENREIFSEREFLTEKREFFGEREYLLEKGEGYIDNAKERKTENEIMNIYKSLSGNEEIREGFWGEKREIFESFYEDKDDGGSVFEKVFEKLRIFEEELERTASYENERAAEGKGAGFTEEFLKGDGGYKVGGEVKENMLSRAVERDTPAEQNIKIQVIGTNEKNEVFDADVIADMLTGKLCEAMSKGSEGFYI